MIIPISFKNYTIHCVGIGGIGMSGIAELLHNLGCVVQGSDCNDNANVKRLQNLGIAIAIGHHPDHVGQASLVVHSSAINEENVELRQAISRRIPILSRPAMLAELMRFRRAIAVAGSHGKTTTTSLLANILESASLSPTVINGGIIEAWGSNVRLGQGEFILAEADESDGSFTRYNPEWGIITNMDEEHLDHYGDFAHVCQAFKDFIATIPFYGSAILNVDSQGVQEMMADLGHFPAIVTYGLGIQADVRAIDIRQSGMGMIFDVRLRDGIFVRSKDFTVTLPMVGEHNVSNALAAIATSLCMNVKEDEIRKGLASFEGVQRRFQQMGMTKGGVLVVNDYAHHPTEIRATLKAARASFNDRPIIAVHQPHRYSRLEALFHEFCTAFNDADAVLVSDVYGAGEEESDAFNGDTLVEGLLKSGHQKVAKLSSPEELPQILSSWTMDGSVVLCMGAGSIGSWSQNLIEQINHHEKRKVQK